VQYFCYRPGLREQARGVPGGFLDGEVLQQAAGLHHRGDQPARDGLARLHPEHRHLARSRPGQPEDHVNGRCLARAIRAEERDDLTRGDVQVDALDRLDRAEALVQALKLDSQLLNPAAWP
jgi:hypothetical protein